MSPDHLIVDEAGDRVVVTVNRPEALNALNRQVIEELVDFFEGVAQRPAIRVVILTGAGERAFVAGADIREMAELAPDEAAGLSARGHGLMELIGEVPQIVIAAVNGFALGGGCELALACDFIVAVEKARFGQPEVRLGVIPGFGGTQRLTRRVGPGRALEMMVTGEPIGADEALRLGLVNAVLPADGLLKHAHGLADKIAARGPLAVAAVKRCVRRAAETALSEGNRFEVDSFARCFSSDDQREGMRAFIAKRDPVFQGR